MNTIVHSFNRNFAKRADGNPNTHAFVASPEMVTALAIAGDLTFNPMTDSLTNDQGEKVMLAEPQGFDLPPAGFGQVDIGYRASDKNPDAKVIITPNSDRLQNLAPFKEWDGEDYTQLPLTD